MTAKVGDVVIYTSPKGLDYNALVTAVWGQGPSALNLTFVSIDESKHDGHGRQIERESSVCHSTVMNVHGRLWRWPGEAKPEYIAPLEA